MPARTRRRVDARIASSHAVDSEDAVDRVQDVPRRAL
jgi:hypothetical protein